MSVYLDALAAERAHNARLFRALMVIGLVSVVGMALLWAKPRQIDLHINPDLRAGDQFGDPICAHPTVVQVRERVAQRHRGGDLLVVQVLDEVGQQREVAKRAGDQVHVRDVQLAEHGEQVIRGGVAVRDVEGGATGGFNQVEDFLALLFGDHPAKHPPEQSDVFTDVVCGLGWHVVSPYSFEFLSGVQHTT